MCKKRTFVSHRSTEPEVISLDAGLRMDGIPALDPWVVVMEMLRTSKNTPTSSSGGPLSKKKKKSRRTSTGKLDTRRNPERKSQKQVQKKRKPRR